MRPRSRNSVKRGNHVADPRAAASRRTIGKTRNPHDAAHPLDRQVEGCPVCGKVRFDHTRIWNSI